MKTKAIILMAAAALAMPADAEKPIDWGAVSRADLANPKATPERKERARRYLEWEARQREAKERAAENAVRDAADSRARDNEIRLERVERRQREINERAALTR